MTDFETAAAAGAAELGPGALDELAHRLRAEWPEQAILGATASHAVDAIGSILTARRTSAVPDGEAAAYLRGLAAGHRGGRDSVTVETVWSGPSSHAVPVRATAQALRDVIAEARHELTLLTYSATPHTGIRTALSAAVDRGVTVTVVVETLRGADGALSGAEPAAAFAGIAGVHLWHWPVEQRTERGSKMHAKVAVADRRILLLASANLTQSGVTRNIEAGLLVRGGTSPQRVAEHVERLRAAGTLRPWEAGSEG